MHILNSERPARWIRGSVAPMPSKSHSSAKPVAAFMLQPAASVPDFAVLSLSDPVVCCDLTCLLLRHTGRGGGRQCGGADGGHAAADRVRRVPAPAPAGALCHLLPREFTICRRDADPFEGAARARFLHLQPVLYLLACTTCASGKWGLYSPLHGCLPQVQAQILTRCNVVPAAGITRVRRSAVAHADGAPRATRRCG